MTQKAEAVSVVTNEFPRGGNYFFVSKYGDGHLLETPRVTARVFYDMTKPAYKNQTGNLQIQVRGYCRGTGGSPGSASVITPAGNPTSTQNLSSCSGGLNSALTTLTFNVSKTTVNNNGRNGGGGFGGNYYGPNIGYVDIQVEVNTQVPVAVKVVATNAGGMVTMRESPPYWENVGFNPPHNPPVTNRGADTDTFDYEDLWYSTAIWNNMTNNGSGTKNDFAFRFETSCKYKPGSSTSALMRWYDADDGGLNGDTGAQRNGPTYDTSIRWRLVNSSNSPATNIAIRNSGTLGGDDEYREYRVNLSGQNEYTWLWENVSATNGIQIWLPFSEMNVYLKDNNLCGDEPIDLCTNIPGVQTEVPVGMTKTPSTPGIPGTCDPPPYPGGGCYFIRLGDSTRVWHSGSYRSGTMNNKLRVVVYNNTGYLWNATPGTQDPNHRPASAWTVYLNSTTGNTNGAGGTATANFGTGLSELPSARNTDPDYVYPNGDPYRYPGNQAYFDYNIDVTNPGTKTVSFDVRRYIGPGNDNLVNGNSTSTCSMTYEITDAQQIDRFEVSCSNITFRVSWASGRSDPIDVSLAAGNGGTRSLPGVTPGVDHTINTFDGWSGAAFASGTKLRPYVNNGINISAGAGATATDDTGGACYTATCALVYPTGSLTDRYRYQARVAFSVDNRTSISYALSGNITSNNRLFIGDNDSGALGQGPLVYNTTTRDFYMETDGGRGVLHTTKLLDGSDASDLPMSGSCGANSDGELITSGTKPYVKAYNADVAAGGAFRANGGTCSPTPKGIFAYMTPMKEQASISGIRSNYGMGGSGGQLASFAWGDAGAGIGNIEGFTSAGTNSNNDISKIGYYLTFGYKTGYDYNTDSSEYPRIGGNIFSDPPCLPDYYSETMYPDSATEFIDTVGNINVATNASLKQHKISGSTAISGISGYTGKRTYYIDGDLNINGSIQYTNYTDVNDIPNFTVVVRGNIHIAPGVTQLDGVYIAQPQKNSAGTDVANTGRIFTCSNGTGNITVTGSTRGPCQNQLRINGAFIAQKVVLGRTIENISNSKYREPAEGLNGSKAAEIFNFSPEVYLSPPIFMPRGSATSGTYDAMAILPPIF